MTAHIVWQGKYLDVSVDGTWEYANRVGHLSAVVIVAIDDGHILLVDEHRVPLGRRCLGLPAGLVGDDGAAEEIETAAIRELEEETGYRAERVERLGEFASSPGMTSETFDLVRATGLTKVGEGGGIDAEDIRVHRVPLSEVPAFVAARRADGWAVDVKLLLPLAAGWLQA